MVHFKLKVHLYGDLLNVYSHTRYKSPSLPEPLAHARPRRNSPVPPPPRLIVASPLWPISGRTEPSWRFPVAHRCLQAPSMSLSTTVRRRRPRRRSSEPPPPSLLQAFPDPETTLFHIVVSCSTISPTSRGQKPRHVTGVLTIGKPGTQVYLPR